MILTIYSKLTFIVALNMSFFMLCNQTLKILVNKNYFLVLQYIRQSKEYLPGP